MKKEESIDHSIKTSWHAISRYYNHHATKHDITSSMGYVLLTIDDEVGTPATKIGPQLGLESRSLTRLLKSMEEKELVYREPDKVDKRLVLIFLTNKGREKKALAKEVIKEFNKEVRKNVSVEKVNAFFEVINDITIVLEALEHKLIKS